MAIDRSPQIEAEKTVEAAVESIRGIAGSESLDLENIFPLLIVYLLLEEHSDPVLTSILNKQAVTSDDLSFNRPIQSGKVRFFSFSRIVCSLPGLAFFP